MSVFTPRHRSRGAWPRAGRRRGAVLASLALVGSGLSGAALLPSSAAAATSFTVGYTVTSSWAGGFVADVTVKNTGDAVSGWTVNWAFPDAGQKVTSAWNATVSQSGSAVTATNVAYNGALAGGASVTFGFQGSYTGSNPVPASFTVNGSSTGGGSTTSTTTTNASTSTSTTSKTTTTTTTTSSSSGGRTWSNTADGFASTGGGTTGGAAGPTVTVSNYTDLLKYATATTPYVIKINATVTVPTMGYEIPVKSDKTLIGVGKSGRITHGGIFLAVGIHNVIIRNLTIGDTAMADDDPDDKVYDYDGIQMDTADHVWIDHNTITQTNDGMIDSRHDTSYLTVSWNIMGNHNKTFGIGWTDNVTARMTIHHNWIHDTNQRNPSVDNVAYAHLYNNYLVNVTSYGNYSRGSTKMVLENSYFDHVNDPYYPDATAQLKQSGSTCVSCTGKQTTSGSAFTPSSFYSYTLDATANVPSLVKTYSGPQANIGN